MGRVKKRELLVGERWKIVNFHREKHSIRKISELTGIAKSTVSDTIARFKKNNSCSSLPRSGRPPVISASDNRYLKLCALRDRRQSLDILTENLNKHRKFPVCQTVVRNALLSWSLYGRVAARKPLLSPRNVKKRLAYAKKHVKLTKKQ